MGSHTSVINGQAAICLHPLTRSRTHAHAHARTHARTCTRATRTRTHQAFSTKVVADINNMKIDYGEDGRFAIVLSTQPANSARFAAVTAVNDQPSPPLPMNWLVVTSDAVNVVTRHYHESAAQPIAADLVQSAMIEASLTIEAIPAAAEVGAAAAAAAAVS